MGRSSKCTAEPKAVPLNEVRDPFAASADGALEKVAPLTVDCPTA